MNIYIEVLRGEIDVRALLKDYGWRLLENRADHLTVWHPLVHDQADVRSKLLQVGLLTSGKVRINFG